MFWRKKKKKAPEGDDWETFARELVHKNEAYMKKLLVCYDKLKDLQSNLLSMQKEMKELRSNNKLMLGVLKMYAKWDDHINSVVNKSKKKGEKKLTEGAATMYLKSIGEYHECDQGKTYGH